MTDKDNYQMTYYYRRQIFVVLRKGANVFVGHFTMNCLFIAFVQLAEVSRLSDCS
jgi:hypothetical protein